MMVLMLATVAAFSQQVQRLDPAVDQLVSQKAKLEKVATGFNKWTEGPVWTRQGTLLFAEIPANSINQWVPGKGASLFIHPSGYEGAEPYPGPEPGSNGMTLDADGRVTIAGHARRNVWRLESVDPHAQITVLADSYKGKKLNSPNDLVYKSDGSLYFTDPPYGLPTESDNDSLKELDVNGIYRVPGARQQKPGASPDRDNLQLLVKDLGRPNGLAFSPDEKYMYVAESVKKFWMRYKVQRRWIAHRWIGLHRLLVRSGERRAGRSAGGCQGEHVGCGARRRMDRFSRRQTYRDDRGAGGSRQCGVWRERPQDFVHRGEYQYLSD